MKPICAVIVLACFTQMLAYGQVSSGLDFSTLPEDECERAINGFKPLAWDGYSEPFSEISNYVAEAQKAVASGENARRIYSELVSRVMECAPPVMIGQKKSYYHAKYQVVEKAIELLFRFGRSRLMNNRKFLIESARFLGQMRVQHEIYRDSRYVMHSVVIMGESEEDRKTRMAKYLVGYQKAALRHMLKSCLDVNGKRFGAYAFYGVFDFYESCLSAGLSPEFVDRLAVLAKVPSGTFRPDPPPKPDIPKQEEPKVQTNAVSAVVAPVAEESPWGDPHPAYYDDTDEMWEGEDNGGDSYWYRISEKGWGRCMKDTASEADLVPQEIKPEGALAERMRRYGMKAYRVGNDSETYRFLLYVPKTKRREKLPMIVYFPGNGEIGEDLTKQFNQSGLFDKVTSAQFQKRHPCALIAVSPPTRMCCYTSGMKDHPGEPTRLFHRRFRRMLNMLDDVVDRNRIYVTGFSWGGHAVYAMGMYYANEFAALFPISTVALADRNVNEKHPGNWWHVANEKDRVADEGCREDVEAFRKKVISFGGDFQVSYFPDNGHDAWTNAWKEDQIWDWMFSKSLEQGKAAGREGGRDGRLAISMADAKCSASVPGADETCGPERVIDLMHRTAYIAARDFTDKDWWMVEFPNPVEGEVRMTSGDANGRGRLKGAYAEVSMNGKSWVRGGGFSKETGECRFTPRQPFRFLRVRSALTSPQHFELRQLLILSAKQ